MNQLRSGFRLTDSYDDYSSNSENNQNLAITGPERTHNLGSRAWSDWQGAWGVSQMALGPGVWVWGENERKAEKMFSYHVRLPKLQKIT